MPSFTLEQYFYGLEIEALMMWFPTKSSASLKEVRMRNYTFRHFSTDREFSVGVFGERNEIIHPLGEQSDDEDTLTSDNSVRALLGVTVNHNGIFEVDIELIIGKSTRRKRLVLEPDTKIPFMINLKAGAHDGLNKDTAVTLQGIFTTTPRPVLNLELPELGKIKRFP
jgi:hypothetical protein